MLYPLSYEGGGCKKLVESLAATVLRIGGQVRRVVACGSTKHQRARLSIGAWARVRARIGRNGDNLQPWFSLRPCMSGRAAAMHSIG